MTDSYNVALGRKIRAARRKADVGVRELARAVEMSASHLSEIEHGRYDPSTGKMQKIAKVLRVDVTALLPPV